MNPDPRAAEGGGESRPILVLAETGGRLGNHLFNFLSWMVLARRHGWTIWNYGFKRYAASFEHFRNGSPVTWPPEGPQPGGTQNALLVSAIACAKWVEAKTQLRMDEQWGWLGGLLRQDRVGYLAFDWRHPGRLRRKLLRPSFENYSCPEVIQRIESRPLTIVDSNVSPVNLGEPDSLELRSAFAVARETAGRVGEMVADLRKSHDWLIGVHMRLTDFRTWEGGKLFIPQEIYAEVVTRYAGRLAQAKPVFVVCSDERIKEELFSGVEWCSGPGDATGDLEILSRCDRIFCTESSFSGWASFAGQVPRFVVHRDGAVPNECDFRVYGSPDR